MEIVTRMRVECLRDHRHFLVAVLVHFVAFSLPEPQVCVFRYVLCSLLCEGIMFLKCFDGLGLRLVISPATFRISALVKGFPKTAFSLLTATLDHHLELLNHHVVLYVFH